MGFAEVDEPRVRIMRARAGVTKSVALVLPGGRETSRLPASRRQLAAVRMLPFAQTLHRHGARGGLAVWTLQYRYRGWNASADPVADAEWALARIRREHGQAPVALVGHSMGGRVAVHAAGDQSVTSVIALAPWITEHETADAIRGRALVIAHSDVDRMTDPAASYRFALDARAVSDRVARFVVPGDRHSMLRRASDWHRLVRRFVLAELHLTEPDPLIETAMATPPPDGLRMPLPRRTRRP